METFLAALFEHGHVLVPSPEPPTPENLDAVRRVLHDAEAAWRYELPGPPPEFSPPAAIWGATWIYRAAQFILFRDLAARTVEHFLQPGCPVDCSAAAVYSVDLTFRFLPDLLRLARTASEQDPLVALIRRVASDWPLSSVGMPDVEVASLDAICRHPTLLAMYVDRVIEAPDDSRLNDKRVRAAVRAACGGWPELAPNLLETVRELERADPSQ